MANSRFSSKDRQIVIELLNAHFDARFESIANYHKLLIDKGTDIIVLMFGSVGDWHGLDEEFMKVVSIFSKTESKGLIVLADKNKDRIDVFSGSLDVFVDEKDKLLRNKDGDYQFHHERIGDKIVLKEDSSLELNLLDTAYL